MYADTCLLTENFCAPLKKNSLFLFFFFCCVLQQATFPDHNKIRHSPILNSWDLIAGWLAGIQISLNRFEFQNSLSCVALTKKSSSLALFFALLCLLLLLSFICMRTSCKSTKSRWMHFIFLHISLTSGHQQTKEATKKSTIYPNQLKVRIREQTMTTTTTTIIIFQSRLARQERFSPCVQYYEKRPIVQLICCIHTKKRKGCQIKCQ